jgi:hypothetical protein
MDQERRSGHHHIAILRLSDALGQSTLALAPRWMAHTHTTTPHHKPILTNPSIPSLPTTPTHNRRARVHRALPSSLSTGATEGGLSSSRTSLALAS